VYILRIPPPPKALTAAEAKQQQADEAKRLGVPVQIGSYPANAFGLHDMHGNAHEWCADGYSRDYYRQSPHSDPARPNTADNGVLRGGSWVEVFRAAHRGNIPPSWAGNDFGFRVVCEIRPAAK